MHLEIVTIGDELLLGLTIGTNAAHLARELAALGVRIVRRTNEADVSWPSERVVAVLEQLVSIHGAPRRIRCDNGPAFVSEVVRRWCEQHGIFLVFIQPGKPNQNAYIERFNRSYRNEILNAWVFTTLEEVRERSEDWRVRYSTERTHDAFGDVPPLTFLPRITSPDLSHFRLCA